MPLILGTNSIKDTGYDVANSCRFEDASDDYLSRSVSSSGNRRTWTWSAWVKRSNISQQYQNMMSMGSNNIRINFSNQNIWVYDYNGSGFDFYLVTNRLFRDISAWMHIVVAVDTTQGTASNRVKLYINGVQETSFSTETYPSVNHDTEANTSGQNNVIGTAGDSLGNNGFHGYMCEVVLIDGLQLDADSFGEFDSDSDIWKPIDVSGLTFGTNGFYLDFEDSSALGNDANGSNNFTVSNLTAIDQSTDTCTNNFATMNPLVPTSSLNFSNGNLTLTGTNASNYSSNNTSNFGVSSGKWYVEVLYKTAGSNVYPTVGISPISISPTTNPTGSLSDVVQVTMENIMYYEGSNTGSYLGSTPSAGNIIQIALDMDNGKVFFGLNGTFVGNPATGSTPAFSGITSGETICFSSRILDNVFEFNFGNPPFTISSGNADGNGYGNFEYSVPSNYYSLCTKNLAEYG